MPSVEINRYHTIIPYSPWSASKFPSLFELLEIHEIYNYFPPTYLNTTLVKASSWARNDVKTGIGERLKEQPMCKEGVN